MALVRLVVGEALDELLEFLGERSTLGVSVPAGHVRALYGRLPCSRGCMARARVAPSVVWARGHDGTRWEAPGP